MDKEKKQLLFFGYGLCIILAIISFNSWRRNGRGLIPGICFIGSLSLFSITYFNYYLLRPFLTRWMCVTHGIGQIMTGLILNIVFYLVFGLGAVILRLLRKDLLKRQIDDKKDSYWIKKEAEDFDQQNYMNQF